MQIIRKHSSTSNIIRFKLRSSTTGQGLTGLAFDSTGGIISTICDNEAAATTYTVAGSTIETITTLATYAAPTSTKCRFKEVDATNHKGTYELQFADARFAVAGAKVLRIDITGFSGMIDKEVVIQLEQVAADVTHIEGDSQSVTDLKDFVDAGYDPSTNKVTGVTLVDTLTTYTGNTPQTGDGYAVLNSGTHGNSALKTLIDTLTTYVDTEIAAIKAKTDNLPTDPADASDIASSFSSISSTLSTIAAYIDTEVAAIKTKTDQLTFTVANQVDSNALSGGGGLDAAGVRAAVGLASANLDTQLGDLPTNAELATALAAADDAVLAVISTLQTSVNTIDDFLDTEIAAILANTDNEWTHIDPTNGTSGGDGSVGDPVQTLTQAVALGRIRIRFVPSGNGGYSSEVVTLPANGVLDINGWKLLNAHNITYRGNVISSFAKSYLNASFSGTNIILQNGAQYINLVMTSNNGRCFTFGYVYFEDVVFTGTQDGGKLIINGSTGAGVTNFYNCTFGSYLGPTTFDFSGSSGDSGVKLIGCYGDISIAGMSSTLFIEHYGWGKLTIEASCTGGTIYHTSHVEITDNSGGAVTLELVSNPNQTDLDWVDGGRLDLILDSRASQTSVDDLPTNAELATALGTADDAVLTQVAAVKAKTDLLVAFPTNFSALGINVGGDVSRVTLVDTVTTNSDLVSAASIATAIFTTQMTESYAVDGVAPTLAQALFLMQQAFTEFAISGTTISVYKIDGSTVAATYTMNSATNPTLRSRAT